MLNLREIYKPKTIEQALALLKQPGAVVLAGGTNLLVGQRKDVRAVVDLSELGLSYIREQEGAVVIGATTPLATAADSAGLHAAANGVVAQAAQRSATSVLRNQATVVGTLIAEPNGILATVLAALEATLTLTSPFQGEGLADFLSERGEVLQGAIVTQVVIPAASLKRRAAIETVARTPGDKPIVSVCAALELENDSVRAAAIALGGVGEVVARASAAEQKLRGQRLGEELIKSASEEALSGIHPLSDFRGSGEYRREMVRVLTARVLRNLVG